jgi:hypothetical protein
MADRKCKYCGSEMDLGTDDINYQVWNCMNEDCNASLTLDENYDDQWEKD